MSQKKVPFFFLNLEDLNKSPHVEHLKYIFCPTQKKAHKPQRCTGLNFYPETQQLTIPYLKRWLSRSIKRRSNRIKKDDIPNSNLSVCVCLVYPDILSPIIGTGIYHVSITQKYVSRHFPNTIFSKDWRWRSWKSDSEPWKGEIYLYADYL